MCAGADMAELKAYIDRINVLREEYGTADRPFEIFTTGQNALCCGRCGRQADFAARSTAS